MPAPQLKEPTSKEGIRRVIVEEPEIILDPHTFREIVIKKEREVEVYCPTLWEHLS